MIVYYKLDKLLSSRGITKTQITKDTGISTNIVSKISKNEGFKTETLNRICEYLKVQPSEIMEWIPDADFEKKQKEIEEAEKAKIKASYEKQIADLKAKLEEL